MGTALVQHGGCCLLCLSLLLLGCWAELGSGLEFPGAEGQWTRFPKWNACCESEMSFQLKTRSARGLVLYFDDEGFCDFLELILTRGGRLQLSFSIFCAEPATLLADTPVNDGAWHSVRIRRQFRNTTLYIDRAEAKWVEVKSKRRDMTVFSGLFVGGLPPELRAAALKLTLASVREREPFKGWIRDVRVNSSQALPVDGSEVKLDEEPPNSGGGSPCEAGDEGDGGVCLNGGVCSVVDDQAVCDCSRTGFRGKDCSQEDNNVEGLAHLMMGDQGKSKGLQPSIRKRCKKLPHVPGDPGVHFQKYHWMIFTRGKD
nr:neurexin-1 isoform X34 [Rattus norvegicus]